MSELLGGDPPNEPTADPSAEPSTEPTADPSADPAVEPTADPSAEPATPDPIVPESYEVVEGSEEANGFLEGFKDIAKELGMTQESFGKVNSYLNDLVKSSAESSQAKFNDIQKAFVEEIKSDPELGGANFGSNIKTANSALDKFGSDNLKTLLSSVGVANNPEMVRFMFKVGEALKDDSMIDGEGGSASPEKTVESILYPNLPK